MSDLNAQFHLSLARVSVTQILRSTGVDRTRLSVLECLSELLVKYLMLLGQRSQEAAESAGRRQCDLVDLREACERMGAIATTSREGVREEEGVVEFISWCMSDEVGELRKFAGEGKDEMGEDVSADWLRQLLKRQIAASGEDRFRETVLASMASTGDEALTTGEPERAIKVTDNLKDFGGDLQVPEIVLDHISIS